jgi:hypothetical protein
MLDPHTPKCSPQIPRSRIGISLLTHLRPSHRTLHSWRFHPCRDKQSLIRVKVPGRYPSLFADFSRSDLFIPRLDFFYVCFVFGFEGGALFD